MKLRDQRPRAPDETDAEDKGPHVKRKHASGRVAMDQTQLLSPLHESDQRPVISTQSSYICRVGTAAALPCRWTQKVSAPHTSASRCIQYRSSLARPRCPYQYMVMFQPPLTTAISIWGCEIHPRPKPLSERFFLLHRTFDPPGGETRPKAS